MTSSPSYAIPPPAGAVSVEPGSSFSGSENLGEGQAPPP
jgi:hypothetical protein